jgi:hypothetical protein
MVLPDLAIFICRSRIRAVGYAVLASLGQFRELTEPEEEAGAPTAEAMLAQPGRLDVKGVWRTSRAVNSDQPSRHADCD